MAPRGRKPKPSHLKLVEGNRGKRKLNTDEPEFELTDIMPPPELDDRAKVEWGRVAHQLQAQGVLTDVDRATLAGYCSAYSTYIAAEQSLKKVAEADNVFGGLVVKTSNGTMVQNPLIGIRNTALQTMNRFAVELGMTPSSRTRIKVGDGTKGGKSKKDDPAQKYGL
jgi:P27 family predicted phage terminase small subunit